jgi:hypothetical protein
MTTPNGSDEPAPGPSQRSLLLVAGSGRSGTSTFSGILQRLGYHVPEPEVPADESNPKGFAESKWVVDFHIGLLKSARVQTADARPAAWADAATAAGDRAADQLRSFLRQQFRHADHVLVKDPRLQWFLPLWRRCALDVGVTPSFVSVLRHPAAVVGSKNQHYGDWQTDASRAAGWLNAMLYTERATRARPRAFVRYDDLLDDWTKVVAAVADGMGLGAIAHAPAGAIRQANEFVDPTLRRTVTVSWDGLDIPTALCDQLDEAWHLLHHLADKDAAETAETFGALDAARERYVDYYRQAESVAQSSVRAGVAAGQGRSSARIERLVTRWIPDRHRRKIPVRWRRAALALLGQRGR